MRRVTTLPSILVLALTSVWAPRSAAQDLRYTTTTKMELAGAMGAMASMMPGMGDAVEQTTYMKGSLVRTDDETTSSIMDWASGDIVQLDHAARTYTRLNFKEMASAMADAMGEAAGEPGAETPDPEAQLEFKMSTDHTGRTETIGGYEADQVLLTIQIVPVEGSQEGPEGTMAVVSELWLSTDFPEYQRMKELQTEVAGQFSQSLSGGGGVGLQGIQGIDPRMGEAWAKNMEAMQELEGSPLRTTMHFVMVPADQELDREAVLAADEEGLGSAAAGAAAEELSSALSRLGRFGRKPEEQEEAAPAQMSLMRATTEITDVTTTTLDDGLFEVPDGYTERVMEMPVRR
jgi:hypothetical protein